MGTDLGLKLEVTGISALLLALAAFFIALRNGSIVVSACLTVQGFANIVAAAQAGASVGIPFGLVVLILGIVKALITLKGTKARARLGTHRIETKSAPRSRAW